MSKKMTKVLSLLAFLAVSGKMATKAGDEEKYIYLSNMSKYESIRGDIRKIDFDEKRCTPLKLWILHRHGTRFPNIQERESIKSLYDLKGEIIANHKKGRGNLTQDDLSHIQDWTYEKSIGRTPEFVTPAGLNETYRTALRYKEKFPMLLDVPYSDEYFYFQHTDFERTTKTSDAFIDGLFGREAYKNVVQAVTPLQEDLLLVPFSGACPELTLLYLRFPEYVKTSTEFFKTQEFVHALKSVSSRLGFEDVIAPGNISAMFTSCGYESAWNQESNPMAAWCAALGQEGRSIAEYYWDLGIQELSGYGKEVTRRAGCGPVKDLWERFGSAVGDISVPNRNEAVIALFSHDIEIMMVHTSLGLLKDDPPLSFYNYRFQNNRQWRTSEIIPFAANIAAVLQECKKPLGGIEYQVTLTRNEKPFLGIAGCPGGICSWESFKNLIEPVARSCNFEEFC